MRIQIDLSSLRRTKWHEYLTRFLIGGSITVITGLIAKTFGPVVGGLFLAFPAIFPATATLVDKHERDKKREAGIPVTIRGRLAVALDARGAAMGSIAMGASRCSYGRSCLGTMLRGCSAALWHYGWALQ